jgi:hypothetical protein
VAAHAVRTEPEPCRQARLSHRRGAADPLTHCSEPRPADFRCCPKWWRMPGMSGPGPPQPNLRECREKP